MGQGGREGYSNIDLNEILEKVALHFNEVEPSRRYWLIRTEGGEYYNDYLEKSYVAIGHNNFSVADINRLNNSYKNDLDRINEILREQTKEKYPKEERPGLIANQVFRFVYEVKEGDIVIIPSERSEKITFGRVTNSDLQNITKDEISRDDSCPFLKRKSVRWDKTISKENLDIYLYKVLHAHQAINDITYQSDIIERTLGDFYVLDNEGNLILDVTTTEEINAFELFGLGYNLLNFAEKFFADNGLDFTVHDIDVKLNLNSPGKIQLKSLDAKKLWLIAILVVAFNGGGLKVDSIGLDLSTDGFIQKMIDFQQSSHQIEMSERIIESLDSLKVESPNDALEILKEVSVNNPNSSN